MASYFDEHDCIPLRPGEMPDHLLHMARLLRDAGLEFEMTFNDMFANGKPPPPASKKAIDSLQTRQVDGDSGTQCPVCLKCYDQHDIIKQLPCKHEFHDCCILPWLEKTNSCPVCRFELPTDDQGYEEYKKHLARVKQREAELETLHDSMFG